MSWQIIRGDCVEAMAGLDDCLVDSVVCDPPAGISFMGRAWDHHRGGMEQWIDWMAEVLAEAERVCKPGAHALVWALPRTSHWTGMAIERAGWEVRDRIAHHFGSGFPKSHNLPNGLGTALKPATEDWWLARKPLSGTVAANVLEHGTGALAIDACRVEGAVEATGDRRPHGNQWADAGFNGQPSEYQPNSSGRWPANCVFSHSEDCAVSSGDSQGCVSDCPVRLLDEQTGEMRAARPSASGTTGRGAFGTGTTYGEGAGMETGVPISVDDSGGASRFFLTVPTDRICSLCGLPCVEVAENPSLRGEPSSGTAPSSAPEPESLAPEVSSPSSGSSATTAAKPSRTTPATPTDAADGASAPTDATDSPGEWIVQLASSVEPLCKSCETSTARSVALWLTDPIRASEVGAASTHERVLRTLSQSLALIAAGSQTTGITPTTSSLSASFGSARNAIATGTEASSSEPDLTRFRYQSKSSRAERNAGLEGFEEQRVRAYEGGEIASAKTPDAMGGRRTAQNVHPTVKPIELMRWLCRLVTPSGGKVLDPFTGSGTTGIAAVLEGFDFIGIEREDEYADIAEARIRWWEKHRADGQAAAVLAAGEAREAVEATGQASFFDEDAA